MGPKYFVKLLYYLLKLDLYNGLAALIISRFAIGIVGDVYNFERSSNFDIVLENIYRFIYFLLTLNSFFKNGIELFNGNIIILSFFKKSCVFVIQPI